MPWHTRRLFLVLRNFYWFTATGTAGYILAMSKADRQANDRDMSVRIPNRFPGILILLILGTGLLISCREHQTAEPPEIARVGRHAISLEEFRRFYELDPNFGIDSTGFPALRDELDRLINHKLSYIWADQDKLLNDPEFVRAVNWEKSRAILRQLYREVVEKKVVITEQELKNQLQQQNREVHVRHLFSPDSGQAARWYHALQQGQTFFQLSPQAFRDSTLAGNGGDLGWMRLGDLDSDFAAAVAGLRKDEISEPVKTRWGHHIIQLLDRKDQILITGAEFEKQRKALTNKVKAVKSAELSKKYIADYIGSFNPQPDSLGFRTLWEAVAGRGSERRILPSHLLLTNDWIEQTQELLEREKDLPLIRYGRKSVSTGEYLTELREIPQSNRPRVKTPADLSRKLATWIRDRLLLEEAYRKRIDRRPAVEKEVREFAEKQTYSHYLGTEYQEIPVPPEVSDYFDGERRGKNPGWQKFHTLQEWKMWRAERAVHRQMRELPVEIVIDTLALREEARTIDWRNRVRMFAMPKPE